MFRRFATARRSALTTLLEITGFGLITAGIWQVSVPAGWISAGIATVLIGALAA